MRMPESGSRLTPELLALVGHIAEPLGALGEVIIAQAASATVQACSATMLDVSVSTKTPWVPLPDGPIPGRALVYIGDELAGEVLLWIRAGRFVGMEQAWFTDDAPTAWPSPDQVRVS